MGKYLYNDVELPVLPEWDRKKYSYVLMIYVTEPNYIVYFSTTPFYHNYYYQNYGDGMESIKYSYDSDTDTWVYSKTTTGNTQITNSKAHLLWANHDIIERSTTASVPQGTIILAGSEYTIPPFEPEPEPETPTLTARDLYKVINGKPTKLTLYKKLGGKLIPLDEHTKEVKT